MRRATSMFLTYVRKMEINYIAFPIEDKNGVSIILINPSNVADCIENNSDMICQDNGELYSRMVRKYTATKVCPEFHPTYKLPTPYKHVKDFPKHAEMRSRGFELIVAMATGGEHTGDKLNSVDVVSTEYGNIECKIGRGKLYFASKGKRGK